MKKKNEILISRGLDSELDPHEQEILQELLAADPKAAEAARSWEQLGDVMRMDAAAVKPPDSTVAWQDIRRAIRQHDESNAPAGDMASIFRLRWAGAIAALLVIGTLGLSAIHVIREAREAAWASESVPRVDWVRAEIPGATTMIYRDMETDLTVIWMDVAQSVDPRDS